jgi:hypothetical protein
VRSIKLSAIIPVQSRAAASTSASLRMSIVNTQLDEAPPSAHEQSVWGKPGASRFQRAELRAWSGNRVPRSDRCRVDHEAQYAAGESPGSVQ